MLCFTWPTTLTTVIYLTVAIPTPAQCFTNTQKPLMLAGLSIYPYPVTQKVINLVTCIDFRPNIHYENESKRDCAIWRRDVFLLARASCQYSYYTIQEQIIENNRVWCCVAGIWPIDFHAWLVRLYKQCIFTELYTGALQQLQPN